MIHAEKKCRPVKWTFAPMSTQLKGRRFVWQMIIRKRQGNCVSSRKIRCIAKAVGIVGNPLGNTVTLREAKRCFKVADKEYQQLKLQAPMKREKFLWDRSRDGALTLAVRKRAKQALAHEQQRDNARHMKHLRGKQRAAGAVTTVGVRQGDDYFEYDDQATIEQLIIENNSARFRLTENTPPMTEPLLLELGYLSHMEAARQILGGTYVCNRDFLKYLQRSPGVDEVDCIDTSFTREDFRTYWKQAKECTSSSLSSLHYGHYKAVINNDKLSEMHSVFVDIAVNLGYSPKQWQKGLTLMLEKKRGVILISKLRAILLMEADFNFANKTIFGWRMMHFAEDRNDIAGECAGSSCKHHEAIDVALNRHLFCDTARQKKCSAAITGADLVQCYDRIAHSIASLGSQRWGVPVNVIKCLLTTIQLMVFFLHTAHGDSTVSYLAATDTAARVSWNTHPYQGSCQGNGGGPLLFLSVSSPCVDYMHGIGFLAHLVSAFSTTTFCIIGILYVDDTDLFAIAVYPLESAEQVAHCMQAMTSHWRGCLLVTGGDLNPDKCCWTPICFYWDADGQWHYHLDIGVSVRIPNSSGVIQALEHLTPSAATTVVGVVQAADGNMLDQVAALTAIADDVGNRIHHGYLPKRLIWQTL
jgi:hypothetical protein